METQVRDAVARTNTIEDFLSQWEKIDLGPIVLSAQERIFYRRMNERVLALCRSLPPFIQTDSLLFLMEYLGVVPGGPLDFFAHYYAPIWSSLYWLNFHLTTGDAPSADRAVVAALTSQSMAMLIHSLDDHLQDGQIPSSPLIIHLRRKAWTLMGAAFKRLAFGIPGGDRIVYDYMEGYTESILDDSKMASLEDYCRRFERQMGIGLIAPVLFATKSSGSRDLASAMEKALRHFGTAWRLLDDIKDVVTDVECGAHSSVYLSLPREARGLWDGMKTDLGSARNRNKRIILTRFLESSLMNGLKKRLCHELELAASIAEAHGISGLAAEFRSLSTPLGNGDQQA
jgi:hypothetical protein